MSPVQGKSPLVQVNVPGVMLKYERTSKDRKKEPYGNLDMVTCRLSSCNLECTIYTFRQRQAVYREREKERYLVKI